MALNKLSHLLGDYNSDSETDDKNQESLIPNMTDKLNEFFNELNSVETNWTQCIDKNTGHPYYWNIETKEVTWEMPAEYEQFLRNNALNITKESKKNVWVLCQPDTDTASYYFNEITREISWEKPEDYIEPIIEAIKQTNVHTVTMEHAKQSKKSRKQPKAKEKKMKTTKKYPFNESTLDDEKIELINSFNPNSESSSDEDSKSEANNRKKQKSNGTKLNLVPEYNSDESDDEQEKCHEEQKSLFAAIAATSGETQSAIIQTYKVLSLEPNKNSSLNDTTVITVTSSSQPEEEPPVPIKKPKTSFASIITGGRSPQSESQNLYSPTNDDKNDEIAITAESNAIETEHLSQKNFKRKRRIEFNRNNERTSVQTPIDKDKELNTECNEISGDEQKSDETQTNGKQYMNFQKGATEFVDQIENNSSCPLNDGGVDESTSEAGMHIANDEITQLYTVLQSKLEFLCQGRSDVSPVQIIQIQLQTLLDAHTVDALHSDYLLTWLNNISTDLIKLENEAAPNGWKCLWNRKKAQYCYKNLTTGDIQWQYPKPPSIVEEQSIASGDDEMDICTTPPPNENEILASHTDQTQNDGGFAPAPPTWHSAKAALVKHHLASGEPLPPGIDASECAEKPLDDELASFYSDIASLDPAEPITDSHTDQSSDKSTTLQETDVEPSDSKDEAKKKKKKKAKKLEPWRSGNLETWINKWQKAQKELDG